MLSAKQQPSNIKHDGAIRPNVCKLTFGPPCILFFSMKLYIIYNIILNIIIIYIHVSFNVI